MSLYDAFAPLYDDWSADMTEDVPWYVELAREADGPLVELAVGSGRVAIPVAQASGRRVLGIDSSPAMLEQAREKAKSAGVELELRTGDMRDFTVDEPAALVYCPYRALLHLPTWRDKRRAFESAARALRPRGRFAWNAFVFDPAYAASRQDTVEEHAGIRHRLHYSAPDNRIDVTLLENGTTLSLWWATRSEWEGLIEAAGLEVEALYGGFDRRPFDDDAREFVWVARKPA